MAFVTIEHIRSGSEQLLRMWGVPVHQARLIADTIVYAHQHEKHTHGITRLPIYRRKINMGLMSPITDCRIVQDFAAIVVMDCQNGFGQIAADMAMRKAIEKASHYGIGATFVRNSNNFGVAGYFGEIAARSGMAGFVVTASAPALAPQGGRKPIFGTNPYCYAFPSPNGNIVLDMSVSVAARGKIRLALKNGEKIPIGWALDKYGADTDNPAEALAGNLLAIGGAKGFGLALVADVLAGLLSGSSFGGEIRPLAAEDAPSRHGHFFAAIDISRLMPENEYSQKIQALEQRLKASAANGTVFMPGERSRDRASANSETVDINSRQLDDFDSLIKEMDGR